MEGNYIDLWELKNLQSNFDDQFSGKKNEEDYYVPSHKKYPPFTYRSNNPAKDGKQHLTVDYMYLMNQFTFFSGPS